MPIKFSRLLGLFSCDSCDQVFAQGVRRVYRVGWADNCFGCFERWLRRKGLIPK